MPWFAGTRTTELSKRQTAISGKFWSGERPGPVPLYWLGRAILQPTLLLLGRWRVEGKENLPQRGGVILAVNHTSYADPPVVGAALPRRVWYMAKHELFSIPVLGFLIRRTCAFPVHRGEADRKALRMALALLEAGEVVCIFPEGTRSLDGRLKEPELGVALLADHSGVPVLPVGLIGTNRLLPPGSPIARPARVRVRIGQAVDFSSLPSSLHGKARLKPIADTVMKAIAYLLPEEYR